MDVERHPGEYDVAYQGTPGAYSEEAARMLLGPAARMLPCPTFESVFDAVSCRRAGYGVLPVENTLAGTVPGVYELLLSRDLHVIGETHVQIDHVLIGPQTLRFEDVKRVLSHPVALAQCNQFFRANPEIQAVPVFDTAGAVDIVMRENDGATAALAARRAAHIYGGGILAEHLQDHAENWTRFLLLASRDQDGELRGSRTLLAFELAHQPGALVNVLQPLADHRMNMTKIESRPITGRPFEYRFIVELTSEQGGGAVREALSEIRHRTSWLRVLGTYGTGS